MPDGRTITATRHGRRRPALRSPRRIGWRLAVAAAVAMAGRPLVAPAPAAAAVDATAAAWGFDGSGQLGDGAAVPVQPVPVSVSGFGSGSPAVAVAAGSNHSLALRADGSVVAWGWDALGQLGDGPAIADQATPVPVSGLGPGSGVVAVAAGLFHSLALRADGRVVAWGDDNLGQLGDGGPRVMTATPVAVSGLGPGSGVVAIAAGGYHNLALRADGSVVAWGLDSAGQVGDGGLYVDQPAPVAVSGLGPGSGVTAVAAGDEHSLAVRADGSVLSWGFDSSGQLGDGGADVDQPAPVGVLGLGAGSGVVALAANGNHSLARRGNGSVLSWGNDSFGQLGDDAGFANRSTPVGVSGLGAGSGVVALAAGYGHSLALKVDGSVLAWGFDSTGQLGDGGDHADQPTPVAVSGFGPGSGVVALAAGYGHSLALRGGRKAVTADYDGSGTTDKGVYRAGGWHTKGQAAAFLGLAGHIPVPADYDGNGITDRAVYDRGAWYVQGRLPVFFGLPGFLPVPADYDGDGDADPAVYRDGGWYVQGQPTAFLGLSGDIPVPADYDGDGDADRAVFRSGTWYVAGQPPASFGLPGDIPVPGDYDGNGTTDKAVWRPSTGQWIVAGGGPQITQYGLRGDQPQPGDYDGNGTTDKAVWRPSTGQWFVAGGGPEVTQHGLPGDIPLALPAAIRGAFF